MRLSIWSLEWRLALRRRRLFVLNLLIPLALVLPISTGGAPAYHASATYTVLFVLFGTFGSAIPLLREGDGGLLRRIVLRGVGESKLIAERVSASTALDLVELFPALIVIMGFGGAGGRTWLLAIPVTVLGLLTANLIGVWVAAVARSMAEGALFAAVAGLFLLHGSGVFRTPRPGTFGAQLEQLLPFAPLHETLFSAAGGGGLSLGFEDLVLPATAAMILFVVTVLVSPILIERITVPVG